MPKAIKGFQAVIDRPAPEYELGARQDVALTGQCCSFGGKQIEDERVGAVRRHPQHESQLIRKIDRWALKNAVSIEQDGVDTRQRGLRGEIARGSAPQAG